MRLRASETRRGGGREYRCHCADASGGMDRQAAAHPRRKAEGMPQAVRGEGPRPHRQHARVLRMVTKRNLASREDWGQLGPAMRALPNDRWRDFVYHYVSHPPGHGAQARAARLAGFAKGSKPIVVAKIAHRLAHDPRMIEAIAEESRKMVRAGAPEAVNALYEMIRDPTSKDRMAAVRAVLSRADPEVAHQSLQVTHRVIDPDQEAVEELRAARALG